MASVDNERCTVMKRSGLFWNDRKNSPAFSRPRSVVPSTKLYPRRSRRTRRCCRGARVARDCARRSRVCGGTGGREIRRRELVATRQRRTVRLVPADDAVLLGETRAIPRLDEHRDAPATRYDPPASHPGPSDAETQTLSSSAAASSARMLAVPSLNPKRFRGVDWAAVVFDVRPKPSCDHRIVARPNAMRLRLRIACTATCGSSAQAWMHRSPSERSGSRSSFRKAGSRSRPAGLRPSSPNRASNSDGPNPNVMVRLLAGSPSASPVSSGGASGDRRRRPSRSRPVPASWRRRVRPIREQLGEIVARGARHHVVRREMQMLLHRGGDPHLVDAGCRVPRHPWCAAPVPGRTRRRRRVLRPRRRRGSSHSPRARGR